MSLERTGPEAFPEPLANVVVGQEIAGSARRAARVPSDGGSSRRSRVFAVVLLVPVTLLHATGLTLVSPSRVGVWMNGV